ncbi:MAG: hypothetical protein PHQ23_17680, partial [Candidatus Wallbacteria bacterium]|nr:hypothetical protein [Candidatus Wallbacteria bacterium]
MKSERSGKNSERKTPVGFDWSSSAAKKIQREIQSLSFLLGIIEPAQKKAPSTACLDPKAIREIISDLDAEILLLSGNTFSIVFGLKKSMDFTPTSACHAALKIRDHFLEADSFHAPAKKNLPCIRQCAFSGISVEDADLPDLLSPSGPLQSFLTEKISEGEIL